ncbi:MAG: bile acid:sodium symporter [Pseudomonadota bacterium]
MRVLIKALERTADFMSGRGTAIILIAAILIGAAMGTLWPGSETLLSGLIDYTILLLVFLLLFEVRLQSLLSSSNRWRFIAAAIVANFVIIPVLGFAIASVFLSAYPLLFIGLVVYFLAPCTDWFLAFTRLAKGNTALGAALLPINMIIQLLLYPLYLQWFGFGAVGIEAGEVFQTLWTWFLIPLVLAVSARFIAEKLLSKSHFDVVLAVVSVTVPILLAVLVWQIMAVNIGTLTANVAVLPLIFGAIFLFFVATYFLSELISKWMRLSYQDRVLMTMTTAARNAPMMLVITMVTLPDQPVIYAAIIVGMLVELPHLIALKGVLMRQRDKATDLALEPGR